MKPFVIFLISILSCDLSAISAPKPSAAILLAEARSSYVNGDREEAIKLATQAIEIEPKNPACYAVRARLYEEGFESVDAIADYDQVLKLDPSVAQAWQHRGSEHFKLGHIKESIADFDKFIQLMPGQAPQHWQRGIALYYADRFEEGRKQFELHQTVNSNDVENAVWHFLCSARANGMEHARATLIPIKSDARVPMKEIHGLFAGKLNPEDVTKAASPKGIPRAQLDQQLFYAHLYLGLYFEALGDGVKARENITKAVTLSRVGDYMGEVARVHFKLRWAIEPVQRTN